MKQSPGSFFYPLHRHCCLLFLACCLFSCNNTEQKPPEVVEVKIPEKIDAKVKELVQSTLQYVSENNGVLNDSVTILVYWLAANYLRN